MQISRQELENIAASIAIAAGLAVDGISLWENSDGSFTATVYGAEHSGTFEEVLAWLAAEVRAEADLALELAGDSNARRDTDASPSP